MEFTNPVQKLLMAILLSAIKKGARTIRMNEGPLVVFFDYDDRTAEEIRPPDQLRDRFVQELVTLAETTVDIGRGEFALELADGTAYRMAVTLSRPPEVFRIALAPIHAIH